MSFHKKFFPNLELLNSGCGLSASAAYTPVFTVHIEQLPGSLIAQFANLCMAYRRVMGSNPVPV